MTKRKTKPRKGKDEGNSYDKIFKENLRELAPGLIRNVLGYTDFTLEALPQVKLQTTVEKEPDFFVKIIEPNARGGRILHIEFEGQDEKIMDWRMEEYLGIGGKVYQMKIEQHLFYLGENLPQHITGRIEHVHFTYCYFVHCLSDISFKEFLYAGTPEEVVFTILSDPESLNSSDLIRMILERLVHLTGDSIAIRKFIKQLIMLSKKRNLHDQTVNQAIIMVGYQDFEDDILYIQGMRKGEEKGEEKGLEKGLEKGMQKGMQKGKEEKDIIAIRNMSSKKFDPSTIAELLEIPLQYVNLIQEQLTKEAEIAGLLKKKELSIDKIAKQLEVSPILVKVIDQHLGK